MESFFIGSNDGTVYKTCTLNNGIVIAQIRDNKTNALLTKVSEDSSIKEGDLVSILYSIKGSINEGGIIGDLSYDIKPKTMNVSTSLVLKN